MATSVPPRTNAVAPPELHKSPWPARIFGLAALIVVAAVCAVCRPGVNEDPRIANPNPKAGFDHAVDVGNGILRRDPLFGVHQWPAILTALFLGAAVVLFGVIGWRAWRERQITSTLVMAVALMFLCASDPYGNWASYAIYDPRFIHFPTDWFYFRLSPTTEPLMVLLAGYVTWFLAGALLAVWAYGRFVRPRVSPSSFFGRHPLAAAYLVGFAVGATLDFCNELFIMKAGLYFYSQFWGPYLSMGRVTLPLVWVAVDASTFACLSVLMWKDDSGRSTALRVAQRAKFFAQRPRTGELLVAWAILMANSMLILLPFLVIRMTDSATHVVTPWLYPETKIYDPGGRWEHAGVEGPFYPGAWDVDRLGTDTHRNR